MFLKGSSRLTLKLWKVCFLSSLHNRGSENQTTMAIGSGVKSACFSKRFWFWGRCFPMLVQACWCFFFSLVPSSYFVFWNFFQKEAILERMTFVSKRGLIAADSCPLQSLVPLFTIGGRRIGQQWRLARPTRGKALLLSKVFVLRTLLPNVGSCSPPWAPRCSSCSENTVHSMASCSSRGSSPFDNSVACCR